MIVYLAFVMYCVNGESGSSLLIESTDSMIYIYTHMIMGLMHVLIIRCSECHLHVYIGIITPHEYYMILPALGISMLSVTTI